ncbi:MAG: hypothetical protein IT559_04185 [Alphaproteobacteria bacterium]|nr:hypothetical protein [Alphaproteobacteria bacterium]
MKKIVYDRRAHTDKPRTISYPEDMKILSMLLLLFLCACAGGNGDGRQAVDLRFTEPLDPSDKVLNAAVQKFLEETEAPVASTYDFYRTYLDSDGRRDALVLFQTPYGYWCDMHGCTMLVLKASDDNFALINAVQPVREPLYISQEQSNGWKNLVMRVSGRWDKAKDVAMLYDGEEYPHNPAALPAYPKGPESAYTRIFIR